MISGKHQDLASTLKWCLPVVYRRAISLLGIAWLAKRLNVRNRISRKRICDRDNMIAGQRPHGVMGTTTHTAMRETQAQSIPLISGMAPRDIELSHPADPCVLSPATVSLLAPLGRCITFACILAVLTGVTHAVESTLFRATHLLTSGFYALGSISLLLFYSQQFSIFLVISLLVVCYFVSILLSPFFYILRGFPWIFEVPSPLPFTLLLRRHRSALWSPGGYALCFAALTHLGVKHLSIFSYPLFLPLAILFFISFILSANFILVGFTPFLLARAVLGALFWSEHATSSSGNAACVSETRGHSGSPCTTGTDTLFAAYPSSALEVCS